MNPWLIGGLALLGSLSGAGLAVWMAKRGWLPWRWHAHLHLHTDAVDSDSDWEQLFDTVMDAAHEYDEPVTMSGHLHDRRYPHIWVTAFRLRRRAVEALVDRVTTAATAVGAAHIVRVKRRCRC